MALFTARVPVGNLIQGEDILFGTTWRISNADRRLQRIALTGGDGTGDPSGAIDLFIGDTRYGVHYASGQTQPDYLRDLFPFNEMVPAGAPIVANVILVPPTGFVYLMLQLSEA